MGRQGRDPGEASRGQETDNERPIHRRREDGRNLGRIMDSRMLGCAEGGSSGRRERKNGGSPSRSGVSPRLARPSPWDASLGEFQRASASSVPGFA